MDSENREIDISAMTELNARDLEQELDWFTRILDTRFALYFGQESNFNSIEQIEPPDLKDSRSKYADFVRRFKLDFNERIAILLAALTHLRPQLLDRFHTKNAAFDRKFTEFGGIIDPHGNFIPTGETLAFVIAGNDLHKRLKLQHLFGHDHVFYRQDLLRLDIQQTDTSLLKAELRLGDDCLSYITGQQRQHHLSVDFPARLVETQLEWDDLVLHPGTLTQVREIEIWLRHRDTLTNDWGMGAKIRPGYRALFYGPPGTGKTMTACLLGKATGMEVYKVDLSLIVSKYIGETEKNLARVFDQAQRKNWLLFFDEADSLFGKRNNTSNSNDRYANQEVSFLLQRIETFDGVAILASNLKENMDTAFARRFESVIYFPMPRAEERLRLWQQGFSEKARFAEDVKLDKIAEEHQLCGGSIMNVVRYASLQAIEKGDNLITLEALEQGIRRERV
jgi:hypothetical protein